MTRIREPERLQEQFIRSREPVLDFVLSRYELSKKHFEPLFYRVGRLYNLYRGWYQGRYQQFRNNVALPLVFSTAWADVARKANTSLMPWPVVTFSGISQEKMGVARTQELLVSQQLRQAKLFQKGVDLALSGHVYGTGIIKTGWKLERRQVPVRQQLATPLSEQLIEVVTTEERDVFNGPWFENVDILDFLPEPNVPRLWDMQWKCRRFYKPMEVVWKLAQAQFFEMKAYRELEMAGMPEEVDRELFERTRISRDTNEVPRSRDRYSHYVKLVDYVGYVPKELRGNDPDDDAEFRAITIANDRVVLRNVPIPYWHGGDGYHAYTPLPDPHHFHGVSKADTVAGLQITGNRFLDQKLDALDLLIDPVFAYDRAANLDTRKLYLRAGKLIGVHGRPDDVLKAIFPDMRGVQAATAEIEQLWRWIQQATGIIEDTVQGGGGGDQTAREFVGRMEAVSIRLMLEAKLFETQLLEPLALEFRLLNRQYLPVPQRLAILGSGALVDKVTGRPIPDDIEVDMAALNLDMDVQANGSLMQVPKMQRQQNAILLIQAAQANPYSMAMVNWVAWWRQMFQLFEFQNVDELVQIPPQQQALMALQLLQGGRGGSGGGAPGGPGGGEPGRVPGTPTEGASPAGLPPLPGLEDIGQTLIGV